MTDFQTTWPIVEVDGSQFNEMLLLFRDLRLMKEQAVRSLQPRICLQCWMIIGIEDAPAHKKHNQTSDFAQMEEANRPSFLSLCKQYDRLTADCKQVILMKVQAKIIQGVQNVRNQGGAPSAAKKNGTSAPKKKAPLPSEVDLTDAIQLGKRKQAAAAAEAAGKKRANTA